MKSIYEKCIDAKLRKSLISHLDSISVMHKNTSVAIILNNKSNRDEHFLRMYLRELSIKNNISVDVYTNKDYFVLQNIFNPYKFLEIEKAKEYIIERLNKTYSYILTEKQKAYYFEDLFNIVKNTTIKLLEL